MWELPNLALFALILQYIRARCGRLSCRETCVPVNPMKTGIHHGDLLANTVSDARVAPARL